MFTCVRRCPAVRGVTSVALSFVWKRHRVGEGKLELTALPLVAYGLNTVANALPCRWKRLSKLSQAAELPFPIHPHMLRHACGYKLAHDGHDTRALQEWLGHSNIQNTTGYTELTGPWQGFALMPRAA